MGKERRDRSISSDGCRSSHSPIDSNYTLRTQKPSSETKESTKEWEDARCPVCMEHPHNAVLLVCSSHEKGCYPYMCDTSNRHSNCLDQFRKSFQGNKKPSTSRREDGLFERYADILRLSPEQIRKDARALGVLREKPREKLTCPLCRGDIKEWIVVEDARHFMNAKLRSCACETCNFSGTYADLRKHARLEHPTARPSEADPERLRSWRRLERQQELGDFLSTVQSDDEIMSFDDMMVSHVSFLRPESNSSRRRNSWSGISRARSQLGVRRRSTRLRAESYDGNNGVSSGGGENNNNQSSDDWSGSRRPRVRRRIYTDEDDIDEP